MKTYLILFIYLINTSCSTEGKLTPDLYNEAQKIQPSTDSMLNLIETQLKTLKEHSKEPNYRLIRDNLYIDTMGNLFLKSRIQEHFDSGDWVPVWINTVYCDTYWTPTENGWTGITELKDFVDTSTFFLDSTQLDTRGNFYKDKNFNYFHSWMADGGAITVF